MTMPRITQVAHQYMQQYLKQGDHVVDATCGNGNDTLFLAKLVGPNGKVYAFDIQAQALLTAEKKLSNYEFIAETRFIHDSHERMAQYVLEPIQGIMFNLGYLPGGDKKVTTKWIQRFEPF